MNEGLLQRLDAEQVQIIVHKVEAAEVDEMWSFVGSKSQQRWLWHAIDHHTGQVLAYVFGTREDHVFLELQALLKPFGLTRFDTDGWGAYRRHIDPDQHTVGKQHTQKIEGVTGRPLSSAIRAPTCEILRDRARRCGKIGSPMSKWGKEHGYPPRIRGAT